jgi:multidrug resistance protein, MATE family
MSMPLIGMRFVHVLSGFVNVVLIAKLGHDALASSALIVGTVNIFLMIVWALFYPMGVIVSRYFAKGELNEVGHVVHAGFLASIIVAIPGCFLMWNAKYLLLLFHQDLSLVAIATPYFHVMMWGILPSLWRVCYDEFAMGILRPRLVIYWELINSPLSVLLAYLLLFGKFGLPKLGIYGVAYASSISYWVLFLGVTCYFYWQKNYRKYIFSGFTKKCFLHITKILQVGWPVGVQVGANSFAYAFLAYMMGWLGKDSLVAHQIASQFDYLAIMIPYGMAQASSVLVSRAIGLKRESIAHLGYAAFLLVFFMVGLCSLVYWLSPKSLISIYLNLRDIENYSSISLAIFLLVIVGFTQLADSISITATGALRGFHDTKIPMLVVLATYWLCSIPLGYFMAFVLHFNAVGLYLGFLFGAIVSSIFLLQRFRFLCNHLG